MKFDLLQEGVPYSFPFFEAYMFVKAKINATTQPCIVKA
jgi:hypothetical protein